jgi:AraC family transcriptional regulator
VLEGLYVETIDQITRLCKPATAVFHPAGEIHSNILLNHAVRDLTVEINQEWIQRFNLPLNALNNPYDYLEADCPRLAQKISEELDSSDEVSNLALEALILDVIVKTSRRRMTIGAMPRWLRQAREILGGKFNSRFSIVDIAENVGIHPVYLASEFRRHCGCTIGAYVRHLRVRYACQQLSSSSKPLAEIALAAGFYDQSHFTRTFRKIVGLTPKQFRACAGP